MENNIAPGTLLISDPFLKDPNFVRTTVLICDHQAEGSFGFVFNKKKEEVLRLSKSRYIFGIVYFRKIFAAEYLSFQAAQL